MCIDELRKKRRELEVPLEENKLAHESSLQFTDRGVNPNPFDSSLEERLIKKDVEEKMKKIIRPIWLIIRAKRMKKLAEEWWKLTTLDSL